MLNERERRSLARIERQLTESDPDLARLFTGALHPGSAESTPTFMLVAGLALVVLGSLVVVAPVAVAGVVLSVFGLVTAHLRPTGFGRASHA